MPGMEIEGSNWDINNVNFNLNAWNGNRGVKLAYLGNFLT